MVEWKEIGEVCYISDYVSNGSFASLRDNVLYRSEPNYAILVRFADYSNGFDKSKFVYIDEHAYKFLSKSNLEGGEIIMSNVGSCGLYFRCPKLDTKMSLAPNSILIKSKYNDYLFHWFGTYRGVEEIKKITSKSAMPKFNKTEFKKIQIPIPSLSEQQRIVDILDTFTDSIENLKEQIAQRRKQYEYYRDQLLDLEGKEGVEMKTLKDICCKANNIKWKNEKIDAVYQYVDLSSVDTRLNQITDTTEINKENAPSRAQQIIKAGDILLGTTRPTLKRYCQVPKHYDNQICSTGYCVFRANVEIVLSRWIYHNIGNEIFWDYCEAHQQGAGYPCLSNFDAFAYTIPVPSLSEQRRIVSILDTFEASIANLEAQLKQREKQYEYYRNKLLTFE